MTISQAKKVIEKVSKMIMKSIFQFSNLALTFDTKMSLSCFQLEKADR